MKATAKSLTCAGEGCEKKVTVGHGVAWVICGPCTKKLASVWSKMAKKKVKAVK